MGWVIKTEDSPQCQNVAFSFLLQRNSLKGFCTGVKGLKELDYRDVYMAKVWKRV